MEKTLAELVREYKGGNEKSFEKIAEKMNPMIMFYAGKLYTWEQEDARQEMLLTLFCSLKKMKYCKSEGECLSYISTRMAQKGCEVTCYNRSGHHVSGAEYDSVDETEYKGITQKYVPTIEKKGARDIIGSTKKYHDN